MTESKLDLLNQLGQDDVEFLWVVFHDYSGRACAKTAPRPSMPGVVESGVVFAKANLNMDANDHQVSGATMLADSGDFLAVPDPRSYCLMPRHHATALTHAFMRQTDGSPWEGCPRTRLDTIVGKLADEGFSVKAALEPEFALLFRDEDGSVTPINASRMYSLSGLEKANGFVVDLVNESVQLAQVHS